MPKVCNGKTKGLALLIQKQYTFENCIVLHKEAKNNTLLKTVLFYTRKPKTIHLQQTLTIDYGDAPQLAAEAKGNKRKHRKRQRE